MRSSPVLPHTRLILAPLPAVATSWCDLRFLTWLKQSVQDSPTLVYVLGFGDHASRN